MIQAIVFDIDGTIMDTEDAVLSALKQATDEAGYSFSKDDLQFVFGIPADEALTKLPIDDIDSVLKRFAEIEEQLMEETKPYKNIEHVIHELAALGIKLGIVTSKTAEKYEATFKKLDLSHYFDEVVVTECTELHKPHGEPLIYCLKQMNVPPSEAVYIGDTIYDNQCAKEAGAKFGLAYWGAKKTKGINADYVLEQPSDILKLAIDTKLYHF